MIFLPAFALLVLAQDSRATPAPTAPRNAQDPFRTDDALRGIVPDEKNAPRNDDFTPLDNAPTMPTMRVRGVVKMKEKAKPAAILEIEGVGRYTVREGERVSFSLAGRSGSYGQTSARPTPNDGQRRVGDPYAATQSAPLTVRQQIPVVLRVEQIASDGVVVEVGTLGERLIIR